MAKVTAAVILCAGRGSRMPARRTNKVCALIAGRAAVCRVMDACEAARVTRYVVVHAPGDRRMVGVVRACRPSAEFAVQQAPLGTADAVRAGLEYLSRTGWRGDVLVVAGDKLVRPEVVRGLARAFRRAGACCALVAAPLMDNPSSGRVVLRRDGGVGAIVEVADLARAEAARRLRLLARRGDPLSAETIRRTVFSYIPTRPKAEAAFPRLFSMLEGCRRIAPGRLLDALRGIPAGFWYFDGAVKVRLSPDEVERRADWANVSVYVFDMADLRWALGRVRPANAQGELYLTDAVVALARRRGGRPVVPVFTSRRDDVLGFNTSEELAAVRRAVRARERVVAVSSRRGPRTVREWMRALEEAGPGLYRALRRAYGRDVRLAESRRRRFWQLLRLLSGDSLDRRVVLVRAPGRVNLMGRHIDHRGGANNAIAIDREILLVACPRSDDLVVARNLDESFPAQRFRLSRLAAGLGAGRWEDAVRRAAPSGAWGDYIAAAALRHRWLVSDGARGGGADLAVWGDLPSAAGLASSSALVTGALVAWCAMYEKTVGRRRAAGLCGEAEWYVGTRGGMGDHAAVLLCRRGKVCHLDFHPFRVGGFYPFPEGYVLVLAPSGRSARKAAGARDVFNARVAAADLALLLLRRNNPDLAGRMVHLRDVNVQALGVGRGRIWRMLAALPERAGRRELRRMLPGEDLSAIFSTHEAPRGGYPIRGVAAFVVSEAERARRAAVLLARGDAAAFGELMRISHDGDRVSRLEAGRMRPWRADLSDAAMAALARRRAGLWGQCGSYACSTRRIDCIVDIACSCPGVAGAQVCGAGLGGAAMILVREDALAGLRERLDREFYKRYAVDDEALACRPIAGCSRLEIS